MNARDDELARLAFWCEILDCAPRPAATGAAVRTVRGAYTSSRVPEAKRAGDAPKPPSLTRRA
jgi:hypothetical protein